MRTIYVLIATKQYDAAPKVLRAFHTEADAIAMKELIDACNPSRAVEIFPTQIDMPDFKWERSTKPLLPAPPFHTFGPVGEPVATWSATKDDVAVGADGRSARIYGDGGPVKGEPFIPENPDGPGAA